MTTQGNGIGSVTGLSNSPTLSMAATNAGLTLGTSLFAVKHLLACLFDAAFGIFQRPCGLFRLG